MQKTEHYQLNQWDAEDAIQRTDFNADNKKIDAAIAALAAGGLKVATGTYKGTGEDYEGVALNVGFNPKLLIVYRDFNHRMFYLEGMTSIQPYTNFSDGTSYSVDISAADGVVTWSGYNSAHVLLNDKSTYYWFAIG